MTTPLRAGSFGVAIFVAVLAVNLLSSSREPAWGDAHGMWEVAESLVARRAIDISIRWPEDIPPGRGGKYYGIAPIGPSLVHLPGAVIAFLAHERAPGYDPLVRPLATHLAPAALGALACVVFFLLLCDLGIGRRTATVSTVILALATTTWVYARYPYSEILQLAGFLGLFRQVLRTAAEPSRRNALWLGAWAGILLNAKYVFASAIVGGLIVIAWSLRARRRELVRVLAWAAVSGGPLLALALAYNWARWGSITQTGYEPYLDAYFGGSVLDGAWGMLLSPGKSALLYSPPLVLAAIGLPACVRAVPRLGFAMIAMVVPVFLVYCTYRSWSGDYAWGPRFFVWATPVVLVPIAWFLDACTTRLRKAVAIAVVVAGVCVQLLGNALYWDHFIRVAFEAKNQWLGRPDRRGSYIPERGRGHCDSCFEDTYEILWTPAFQPIRGHFWLVRSLARGDTADEAQRDAPWRTYTRLPVQLSASYARVRIDWWGLVWLEDAPATRPLGLAVLAGLVAALGWAIWRWRRLWQTAPP
ncbi:MAG TPA: hypothetical protein VFK02_11325 [Kofleriaceae bacterium]|nr:hypothetical protein [Kofleriaceae bacterium]